MIFRVQKLSAVDLEISALTQAQQNILKADYNTIEQHGIEFVKIKHL